MSPNLPGNGVFGPFSLVKIVIPIGANTALQRPKLLGDLSNF
jgi:hypothetical protein